METTGVVRRIDDLGRIVIPKEIRRTLRIKDGSSLEIFVEKDMVALKKYSSMKSLDDFAELYADSINQTLGNIVIITDCDSVIACSGLSKKEYLGKHLSSFLEKILVERENLSEDEFKEIEIIENKKIKVSFVINTIVSNGDVIGLVCLLSKNNSMTDLDRKIALVAAQFLGKHIEE